jgi:hypothetical protein
MENLKLTPRTTVLGAGIYEAGTSYQRLFVTDSGKVLSVTGRVITENDLLTAYRWGREDEGENQYKEESDEAD